MNEAARVAVLLVGGRSRRMRTPKLELAFGRETLLERNLRVLRQVATRVVVVRAADQSLPVLPAGVLEVEDERSDQGPLEGLRAGLKRASRTAACASVTAVDVPFLAPAFLERLFTLLASHDAVVPEQGGRRHPLSGCYRTSVAEAAEELLARGERSVQALLDRIDTRLVGPDEFQDSDPELRSLWNLNTPEDYRAALLHFEHLERLEDRG